MVCCSIVDFGVLVVLTVGVMNSLNIQDQLFDGALKEADYWSVSRLFYLLVWVLRALLVGQR